MPLVQTLVQGVINWWTLVKLYVPLVQTLVQGIINWWTLVKLYVPLVQTLVQSVINRWTLVKLYVPLVQTLVQSVVNRWTLVKLIRSMHQFPFLLSSNNLGNKETKETNVNKNNGEQKILHNTRKQFFQKMQCSQKNRTVLNQR